jgi:voltage-gated potassium channel
MVGLKRALVTIISMMVAVLIFGTLGYVIIERWSVLDSIYMASITLTTVGFGEIHPLSDAGRIFTIVLIFLGLITIAFGLSSLGEYLVSSDLGPRLRRRRNERMITKMRDHVIVCGYGRVGRSAVGSLMESRKDVVIIDKDATITDEVRLIGLQVVHGDATSDDILRKAGIERADSLMICGGSDADNLFIVLSSRTMNPDLTIVARSVDPENESKMVRAGANRVISPYRIGGRFMASVLIRPGVTDFFQQVTLESGLELWLEEMVIGRDSNLDGQTVFEADIRRATGVTMVGLLRHSSGETLIPDASTSIEVGDVMIVIGTREQLAKLQQLAESPKGAG